LALQVDLIKTFLHRLFQQICFSLASFAWPGTNTLPYLASAAAKKRFLRKSARVHAKNLFFFGTDVRAKKQVIVASKFLEARGQYRKTFFGINLRTFFCKLDHSINVNILLLYCEKKKSV
jgi:hypothetical protein